MGVNRRANAVAPQLLESILNQLLRFLWLLIIKQHCFDILLHILQLLHPNHLLHILLLSNRNNLNRMLKFGEPRKARAESAPKSLHSECVFEHIELFLQQLGFRIYRARHHGDILRLEIGQEEIASILNDDIRKKIIEHAKSQGFLYVTVDLEGYRTGSMNKGLDSLKIDNRKEAVWTKN